MSCAERAEARIEGRVCVKVEQVTDKDGRRKIKTHSGQWSSKELHLNYLTEWVAMKWIRGRRTPFLGESSQSSELQ